MVNPWQWDGRNPYYATAFQILDVDPTADRATVRARVAARRKRISYDPQRFPLFGEILDLAQVNAAEELLADPRTRLAAELLTHHPEPDGDDLGEVLELLVLAHELPTDDVPPASADTVELDYTILPTLLPPRAEAVGAYLDEETDE